MPTQQALPHTPFEPFDPTVGVYQIGLGGYLVPREFTGWKDEALSWKTGCYLHAGLNPTLTYRLTGPDALRLLSDVSVNSFAKFSIGAGKHLIMCNEAGNMMTHGMCLRTGEEEFLTYWLAPYLPYFVESSNFSYDVEGHDLTGQVFLFQVAGPRSLEVLEATFGEDLHDIRFIRHRRTRLDGAEVTILRIGMAGTLAYEVHGLAEDAQDVYAKILQAGESFGIRRLGNIGYTLNHTENGFVQSGVHFIRAWAEDPAFTEFQQTTGWGSRQAGARAMLAGSLGSDVRLRYCTPVDVGWTHMIKFDHEFIGRAALEVAVANPRRRMVTLVWNPDDIMDVYMSQLRAGSEYKVMELPCEPRYSKAGAINSMDRVMRGDEVVGFSSGRVYSYFYRDMISLCSLATDSSEIGTEVEVVWGDEGTPEKRIRATVARFPYLDLPRNEEIDVESIPRGMDTKAVAL